MIKKVHENMWCNDTANAKKNKAQIEASPVYTLYVLIQAVFTNEHFNARCETVYILSCFITAL